MGVGIRWRLGYDGGWERLVWGLGCEDYGVG